jgi:hypothetical protein
MKTSARFHHSACRLQAQRGHALLLSAIIGTLAFALWLVAFRTTNDARGYQESAPAREIHMEAMPSAMATAARLLKTGEPPTLPYRCIYKYYMGPGTWENLILEFKRGSSSRKFIVEVTRASGPEAKRYPDAPMSF